MEPKTYILNGAKVGSLATLGRELRAMFYFNDELNLKCYDVISDVLQGGYGCLDYQEKIVIIWQQHKTSQRCLDNDLYDFIKNGFDNPRIEMVLVDT